MEINLENKWWKYLIFFIFALIVTLMIIYHEPWFDESRAWVIARDANPISICGTYMRYEGSPPLWHFILMPFAKPGMPLITLNIICALIALFSLYLFLRFAPFPLIIKILFPFTYFFLYQQTIVARSYVLIPPLLFLIAIIYEKKTEKIYYYILLLCLLSLSSLHGLIIALALIFIHLLDLIKAWPSLSTDTRKKQYAAFGIFAAITTLIVLMLIPPHDLSSGQNWHFGAGIFYRVFKWSLGFSMIGTRFWYLLIIIFAISLVWFWRRKTLLLYLLPTLGLLFLFSIKTVAGWHLGVLFIIWIFSLWISFDRYSGEAEYKWKTWLSLKNAVLVCMVFVFCIQIIWTVNAVKVDLMEPYSGSRYTAEFIKKNKLDKEKIYYVGANSISAVLAYFDHNIFTNYETGELGFDTYSNRFQYPENIYASLNNASIKKIQEEQPDYVIAGGSYTQGVETILNGYELINVYSGFNFNIMDFNTGITDQFLVFKRTKSNSQSQPANKP